MTMQLNFKQEPIDQWVIVVKTCFVLNSIILVSNCQCVIKEHYTSIDMVRTVEYCIITVCNILFYHIKRVIRFNLLNLKIVQKYSCLYYYKDIVSDYSSQVLKKDHKCTTQMVMLSYYDQV